MPRRRLWMDRNDSSKVACVVRIRYGRRLEADTCRFGLFRLQLDQVTDRFRTYRLSKLGNSVSFMAEAVLWDSAQG